MSEESVAVAKKTGFSPGLSVLLIVPLIILGGVIFLFLQTGGGLDLRSPVPVERVTVERTILSPGQIQLVVRNGSPQDVTIAQASVNAAIWPLTASPSPTIPRLSTATVT